MRIFQGQGEVHRELRKGARGRARGECAGDDGGAYEARRGRAEDGERSPREFLQDTGDNRRYAYHAVIQEAQTDGALRPGEDRVRPPCAHPRAEVDILFEFPRRPREDRVLRAEATLRGVRYKPPVPVGGEGVRGD